MNPYRQSDRSDELDRQAIPLQNLRSIGPADGQDRQNTPVTRIVSQPRSLTSTTDSDPATDSIAASTRPADPTPWTPVHQNTTPTRADGRQAGQTGRPGFGIGYQDSPGRPDDPFVQRAPVSRVSSFDQNTWRLYSAPGAETRESLVDDDTPDDSAFSPPFGDRTPLTMSAQPVGTTAESGPARDRSHTRTRTRTPNPSFLAVDTDGGESGLRPNSDSNSRRSNSFSHHLSPMSRSQALHRAGTIVRDISRRVVNLTNVPKPDDDPAHGSVGRKGSASSARSGRTSAASGPARSPSGASGAGDRDGRSPSRLQSDEPKDDGQISAGPGPFDDLKSDDDRPSMFRRQPDPFPNPLKGRSLGFFKPDNPVRKKLCDLLVHPAVEPMIFVLIVFQAILLTGEGWNSIYDNQADDKGLKTVFDYSMLGLFVVYTLEIVARIIVSGFVINPIEYSTINRKIGLKKALGIKWRSLIAPYIAVSQTDTAATASEVKRPDGPEKHHGVLRSFTSAPSGIGAPLSSIADARYQRRVRLAERAFLRHSFNRLDFVAVTAFWIHFVIRMSGREDNLHLYLFRMLSALRILRLLLITSGTTMILRSLKKAAPLLLHVAFLISFFWLLFAIIGVQSFKSSLRRQCVWIDPAGIEENYTVEFQFCGGYLTAAGEKMPWVYADMVTAGASTSKGYLCPPSSLCVEGGNPYNGSIGFDNIFQSLELVFVVMSSNTFSDLMYYLTDSDYLAAALFFASGILILYFWLINLLVAVITTSFQVIRDESKVYSAFTSKKTVGELDPDYVGDVVPMEELVSEPPLLRKRTRMVRWIVAKLYRLFVVIILLDLITQATKSTEMTDQHVSLLFAVEVFTTLALDVEMLIRFVADWRHFWTGRNIFDLVLAVITTVMLLPRVWHENPQMYAWLTVFQIVRVYRVIMEVPLARDLLSTVMKNRSGLLNLFLFTFLLNFLAAIFATQMFRHLGLIPQTDDDGNPIDSTFATIYNSFLTMYQIMSSEGWTTPLYSATQYTTGYGTAWINATFFILWFILSNFIVLNMFIAVIQESFDVSEDEKRLHQVKAFLSQRDSSESNGNLSFSALFRSKSSRKDPTVFDGGQTASLLKDAVVNDFLALQGEGLTSPPAGKGGSTPSSMRTRTNTDMSPPLDSPTTPPAADTPTTTTPTADTPTTAAPPNPGDGIKRFASQLIDRVRNRELNPFYSEIEMPRAHEEMDAAEMARQAVEGRKRLKQAQEAYLLKHPNYNVSLYLFRPDNPVRRFCQKLVGPSRGETRVNGDIPSGPLWLAFSGFVYAAVVAMVLLACVVTPLYQKEYFATHGFTVRTWFVFADLSFAVLFTVESVVKVIADGLLWTPNAYLRGSWSVLDTVVLVTLWINVIANLSNEGQVSRAVGAFKALRALRLLNVSDAARRTFHAVIIQGGTKIVSTMVVSLGLLIPFAIYGLNLFMGKFRSCNDGGTAISNLTDCVGDFSGQTERWDVLAPRVADNPYFSFDNFPDSIFILFQIVSQEGWSTIMWQSQSLTKAGFQPETGASRHNAVFFVAFNLLGSVFVLTLFVSVFMRNYTEQTGVAFLTTEQRSWLELRKLLKQVSPSKRPVQPGQASWTRWCYRQAVLKSGRWQQTVTALLVLYLLLLCTDTYPSNTAWDIAGSILTLMLSLVFSANIVIRFVGLGWSRFWRSGWDMFAPFAVFGTLVTQIIVWAVPSSRQLGIYNKLFMVAVPLLLIPRNDQLDQLFKTAAASLPAILNLVATWFVLFLVFAIAFTQTLGLTKFGQSGGTYVNFRTVPNALILLFRISIGEGWNQVMEDFATMVPPACTASADFVDGDCGSPEWARFLFVFWSIVSMYIFTSLLVSLIYESFSYVYQRSSGLAVLSRDEIRRFKQAWAEFDPAGSGYMSPSSFALLLGRLSGVFDMRIYSGDFSVRRIVDTCRIDNTDNIDLDLLNDRVTAIPVDEIQNRRQRLNMFYEEVLVSAHPVRGIGFTNVLMTLAHYKLIDDCKSLRLSEFLHRRARLQRVDEAVRRNIVRGFLETAFAARRLRIHRRALAENDLQRRISSVDPFSNPVGPSGSSGPDGGAGPVPEIVVSTGSTLFLHPESAAGPVPGRGRASTSSAVSPFGRPESPTLSGDPDIDLSVSAWDRVGGEIESGRSPSPHAGSRTRPSSIQESPERLSRTNRFLSGLGFPSRRPSHTGSAISGTSSSVHPPIRSPSDSSATPSPLLTASEVPVGTRRRARTTTAGPNRTTTVNSSVSPASTEANSGLAGAELLGVAEFLGVAPSVRGRRNTASTAGDRSSRISSRLSAAPIISREPSRNRSRSSRLGEPGTSRAQSVRAQEAVQEVLNVLGDSAWGDALRRTATRREGRSPDNRPNQP